MRILLANLELLLERRGLWLTCLFYGVLIGLGVLMAQVLENVALFMALAAAALPAGWTVAGTQVEVASKPFSFCLPGRGRSIRRFIFLVGLALSAVAGWALAMGQAMGGAYPAEVVHLLCLGSCLTLGIYLVGVGLAFLLRNSPVVSGLMGLLVWGLFMFEALHPNSFLVVRDYSLAVILAGVCMAVVAWWLGRANRFRAYCDKPVLGPLFARDNAEVQRKREAMAAANLSRPLPAIDRYFVGAIASCQHPGGAKCLWGTLYMALLQTMAERKMAILAGLMVFACFLWAGYDPSGAPFFIIVFPLIGATSVDELRRSVSCVSPIAGGRRERFYATIALLGLAAGISVLGLLVVALVLNLLMPFVPEVSIGGRPLVFHPLPLGLFKLPMMAFPLLGLASFWCAGRSVGRSIPGTAVFIAGMLLGSRAMAVCGVPLQTVLLVTILSWLVCVLGVYGIAMRSDLVRR
jgi:hypothetical protein